MQRSKAANPFLQAASCPLWSWEDVFPLCVVLARCIFVASLFSEASNINGCQRQAMRLDGPSVCPAVTYPEPCCVLVYVARALVKLVRNFDKKYTLIIVSSPSACDHRITEWSGLEGTSVGRLVQPPAEAGSPTAGCTGPCPGGS